jgi:hypothetical protein
VTSVTETIAVREYCASFNTHNQEGIMSLLYHTNEKADLKHTDYTDYGFILALFCMVLVLVVASAIFAPAPVGIGITNEITSVGP